jgi:outer membrane protein assembly factor BamB
VTAEAQIEPSAWSQLQGDAAHTGVLTGAPVAPFAAEWTASQDAASGQHLSTPVVSGDTIVVTGPDAVYAVAASDGSTAWHVDRDAVPIAPAIGVVGGSEAVISTNGRGPDTATADAYDLATGRALWHAPAKLKDESKSGVTIDGERGFVGDESGTLYGIDLADGKVAWTAATGGSLAGPVAVGDGAVIAVVAASDANRSASVIAFDEATGHERWNVRPDATATFGSLPAVTGGAAVVAFPDGEVLGLSTKDGSVAWREHMPALVSPFVGPAVAGDSLVFADSTGGVHLVTPGGGRSWLYEFNEPILRASPVVAGDDVVVGLEDGSVGAVSLRTGHLVFRTAATDAAVGGLALTPDAVIASRGGSGAPEVVALRNDPSGALLDEASPTEPVASELAVGFVLAIAVAVVVFLPGRALTHRMAIVDPSEEPPEDLDAERGDDDERS